MNQKIALVTGGSRGLGKDMSISLAQKGLDVILTYKNRNEDAEEVVDEIRKMNSKAMALQFDISKTDSIGSFTSLVKESLEQNWKTDRLDFLINNAGIGATIPMSQVTENVFDEFVNIHFKGVYFLTQRVLPMINDHGGIIFISTGTTRFCRPGYSVYASLKGAIEILTKYVAKEYGDRGIRSNIELQIFPEDRIAIVFSHWQGEPPAPFTESFLFIGILIDPMVNALVGIPGLVTEHVDKYSIDGIKVDHFLHDPEDIFLFVGRIDGNGVHS
jgi:NAD(P)-dependent dehydrogenase (short-subunit alcohol dehydrogenase family)